LTATCKYDVLVIGSGAAGLSAALALDPGLRVGVLAKGSVSGGSTALAQGGIAAVLEPGDTFESHVEDTIAAGAGLNRRETVELVVGRAPEAIERLAALGVPFNRGAEAGWHLTREGGHSHRRIVHVADATGRAVQQALEKAAREHPNISLIPNKIGIDLVTGRHTVAGSGEKRVWGLYALDRKSGRVEPITARATILATGGASRAWLYSDQSEGLDRRRHCNGLAGGVPRLQHGVRPVPPDLPVPPGSEELPDHRGDAGRRRATVDPRIGAPLHARVRRPSRARPARRRRPRDRP
jgi:L-aspartate oxidase